jgi:hypothetical protein
MAKGERTYDPGDPYILRPCQPTLFNLLQNQATLPAGSSFQHTIFPAQAFVAGLIFGIQSLLRGHQLLLCG